MNNSENLTIISQNTQLKGDIKSGRHLEIYGYVEGDIKVEKIIVHEGGKLFGTLHAGEADIGGTVQGDITIRNLMNIDRTGSVTGNVKYGRLALESGGELSAELRNIPPEIGGDLHLNVSRGKSVPITLSDLSAFDPDDGATALTFTVSNAKGGIVAFANAPAAPIGKFTQADLESGKVMFVHNGGRITDASFDVIVVDGSGATSGDAKTVAIDVRQS